MYWYKCTTFSRCAGTDLCCGSLVLRMHAVVCVFSAFSSDVMLFWLSLLCFGRVKERSSDLPLLIKPNEPISGIRLSSGISHSRKRIYRINTSARFGLQQLFDNLHEFCQMAFSLTFFGGLPFWYFTIRLLLSCCQPLLYHRFSNALKSS